MIFSPGKVAVEREASLLELVGGCNVATFEGTSNSVEHARPHRAEACRCGVTYVVKRDSTSDARADAGLFGREAYARGEPTLSAYDGRPESWNDFMADWQRKECNFNRDSNRVWMESPVEGRVESTRLMQKRLEADNLWPKHQPR